MIPQALMRQITGIRKRSHENRNKSMDRSIIRFFCGTQGAFINIRVILCDRKWDYAIYPWNWLADPKQFIPPCWINPGDIGSSAFLGFVGRK